MGSGCCRQRIIINYFMFFNNTPISVILKIFGIEPKFQESESCVLTNWTISPFVVPEIIHLFKRSVCNPSTISSL
jgi:hypothetical protein